ncbi:MAG: hypothetical protein CVV64_04055 [Candidatus Wallbacteria bacterium HGW-Wallbacteria-1]|jgi:uncharacterized protein YgiM (DUF1202 family)|uniref:SH3b domain-containing protein n=1 Tax=Candidatus Wallbacteria bacterium HGW-Wallbacteria-1 TaxID=2013854 RepID=A0A2N1PRH8_9BACT|nr:MAG: hypothetical protein CVV64_04055 [Candidatus Wallbacteria bacterium HGW-Wallbacteria-1]
MRIRLFLTSVLTFLIYIQVCGQVSAKKWDDFPEWIMSEDEFVEILEKKDSQPSPKTNSPSFSDSARSAFQKSGSQTSGQSEEYGIRESSSSEIQSHQPVTSSHGSSEKIWKGIVTGAGVNCRRGPTLYETVIFKFRQGIYLDIRDFRDGWYQVELPLPMSGWIFGKYLKISGADTADAAELTARALALSVSEKISGTGLIVGNNVNVRTGPTIDDPFHTKAFKGEKVIVLDSRDGWHHICWVLPRLGWIHESCLVEKDKVDGTVLTSGADVRHGPGNDYDLVRRVLKGMKLPVIGKESGWFRVALPTGQTGYISNQCFVPPASMAENVKDSETTSAPKP